MSNIPTHEQINAEFDQFESLLEYASGTIKAGAKYIQRLGTPGNYIYVYDTTKGMSKKMRSAYGRLIKKNQKLFDKMKARFDPRSFNARPANSWGYSILTMNMKNGDMINMYINLKNTAAIGYRRSHRGTGLRGYPIKMARAKKKGILRYRGISV